MSEDNDKLDNVTEVLPVPPFARTLCWAFMLDQLTLIDAAYRTAREHGDTEPLRAVRQYLWNMVHRGPTDEDFVKEFVVPALTTTDEILTGLVDPKQAIALLNDEGLTVVEDGPAVEDDQELPEDYD